MAGTIDFQQACDRVRRALTPWPHLGDLYVAPYGAEDETHWQVVYGNREALVDDDPVFVLMDAPIALVSKATGEIEWLDYLPNMARVNAMRPFGEWPE